MKFAALLIVLHSIDGHPVLINPEHVTSLRPARDVDKEEKLFPHAARCMVNLTDGKFVNVVENCDVVLKLLEGAK